MIDITDVDKTYLLRCLWEMAPVVVTRAPELTLGKAQRLIADMRTAQEPLVFEIVHGRKIDVDMDGDSMGVSAAGPEKTARAVEAAKTAKDADVVRLRETLRNDVLADMETRFGMKPAVTCLLLATLIESGPDSFARVTTASIALLLSAQPNEELSVQAVRDSGALMAAMLTHIKQIIPLIMPE